MLAILNLHLLIKVYNFYIEFSTQNKIKIIFDLSNVYNKLQKHCYQQRYTSKLLIHLSLHSMTVPIFDTDFKTVCNGKSDNVIKLFSNLLVHTFYMTISIK